MDNTISINNISYQIIQNFDNSNQKQVYKVKNINNEYYIIKILKFKQIEEIKRLFQEIDILKKINSNNFTKIYAQEIDVEKKEFKILEEFVEGKTLREKISEYKENEQKCIQLFKKIIVAMTNLWENNIIHRDLKPENIIIKENDEPVILDLGIVKCLNSENNLTLINERMPYTNYYCAPEQYKNETLLISIRTDFFILGIVLGEMYTGKHIFENENGEKDILGKYNETNSKKINNFLKKLLAKEPFDRFRTEKNILNYIEKEWGI